MKDESVLPELPSELIELALDDLEKAEKSADYYVDMGEWHVMIGPECHVCLAGAVMAFSLKTHKVDDVAPSRFVWPLQSKLVALDYFRIGLIDEAVRHMGFDWPGIIWRTKVKDYSKDPHQFKVDMKNIVKTLKEHNL